METVQDKLQKLWTECQEKVGQKLEKVENASIIDQLIFLQNQALLMSNVAILNRLDNISHTIDHS